MGWTLFGNFLTSKLACLFILLSNLCSDYVARFHLVGMLNNMFASLDNLSPWVWVQQSGFPLQNSESDCSESQFKQKKRRGQKIISQAW